MSLLNLPDEVLLGICDEMDDSSLSNFVQSTSRGYSVCSEILQRRKKKKLASVLEQKHIGMPLDIFEQLIKETDLSNYVLEELVSEWSDNNFLGTYEPGLYEDSFDYHLPPSPPGKVSSGKFSGNLLRIRIDNLNEVEKEYFKVFTNFLMSTRDYVIGINPDNSLKIITVPFNSDASLLFERDDFHFNYWLNEKYFKPYEEMMIIKYLQ